MSRITSQMIPSISIPAPGGRYNPIRPGFTSILQTYPLVMYVFIAGTAFDALDTVSFVHPFGSTDELHPLIRVLSSHFGPVIPTLAAQGAKCVFALILLKCLGRRMEILLLFCAITSFMAGIYNVFAGVPYRRDILPWLPL